MPNDTIAKVTGFWIASELLWEAACEDDRDFAPAAEACGDAYRAAVQALEEGDNGGAIRALERAKSLELDGGDAQHATAALALVSEVLS